MCGGPERSYSRSSSVVESNAPEAEAVTKPARKTAKKAVAKKSKRTSGKAKV